MGLITDEETATFGRKDGHSLELGVFVIYKVMGTQFSILATRAGIKITGEFPWVERTGAQALIDMIHRALRQHEQLASTPLGQKQTPLTEEMLAAEEFVTTSEAIS